MKKRITIKSQLIEHMLNNGNNFRYTDMVKFILSLKGIKYDSSYRGYYSCAFSSHGSYTSNFNTWDYKKYQKKRSEPKKWTDYVGYMFHGHEFIFKNENGRYSACRLGPHFKLKEFYGRA